jgi:hypothetical protein
MDDVDLPHTVTLAIVYTHEDLIEVEAVVRAGHWRGRASAYTAPQNLAVAAAALQRFADGSTPGAEFAAGADSGVGLVAWRFYRIDRAGHIACHFRLASGGLPTEHRPEEVAQLSVEVRAEAWAVGQFARQLVEQGRLRAGQASLALDTPGT